ncbi:MAG TPA: ribonuclease HII [Algoriphagus sp.]|jgi:ribonuclease HII|uniref:ribonuclease HII n=1 Tax=unclassified Algoriphagus TaxID=2641541 RepID=UPI000C4BBFA7|nr:MULTISPECIES: ribonuclease HII [unclassified Algoriphagus]MAL13056.1 ribonuclease HII [Algoriphagus sp.]MAN85822.1 ribonuclease HII [Algoriphagus sp.]QYH39410.1 ribonuclease HII [Algoriphagus sp. NBT04N3]HAS60102.1 ribonuclease HII [Algoriphagus sp.]HCB46751.1 ribonuclease HII [Algoriphagus sp.]|tara:strand:- start:270 stop:875 length:606 start_codon:yes stop_codon:yes gene_type:complete
MALLPYLEANRIEAGCDEVGRGCLAGPVVAAAVILPADYENPWINDSKKLGKSQREELIEEIKLKSLDWAIAEATVAEIDQINILNASFLAMSRAIEMLKVKPEHLLIDGNRWKSKLEYSYSCIIKGDGKFASIAAASILAKVHRDQMMEDLATSFPHYGWESNVGYPTKTHREGIQKHGISPWHRKSFQLLPRQLDLGLQ